MNERGHTAFQYLMTYGWALLVTAIVVGVIVFITIGPQAPEPAERWEEEWYCSKEIETGELVNCRKEEKCFQCPSNTAKICNCEKTIVCDRETKCVEQRTRKCLVTTKECKHIPMNEMVKECAIQKTIETRECEVQP